MSIKTRISASAETGTKPGFVLALEARHPVDAALGGGNKKSTDLLKVRTT